MHLTNVPLILSSLCFLVPCFSAVDTGNTASAVAWGALTVTSTLLHATKQPFHLHGPGNCIPWLYTVDVATLYVATLRACYDAWIGGSVGPVLACVTVSYACLVFYGGQRTKRFAFDPRLDMSILSHATMHCIAAWGATAAIYIRAFKNGHLQSLEEAPQ